MRKNTTIFFTTISLIKARRLQLSRRRERRARDFRRKENLWMKEIDKGFIQFNDRFYSIFF